MSDTDEKVGPLTANPEDADTLFYSYHEVEQPVLLVNSSYVTLTNSPGQASQRQKSCGESKLNPCVNIDKDESDPRFENGHSKGKSGALEKPGYISKASYSVENSPSPIHSPIEFINNGLSSSDDNSSISSTSTTISSICDKINSGAGIGDKVSAGINSTTPSLPVDVNIVEDLTTPEAAMMQRSEDKIHNRDISPGEDSNTLYHDDSCQSLVSKTKASQCDPSNPNSGIYKRSTSRDPCHSVDADRTLAKSRVTSSERTASAQKLDQIAVDPPSLETPTIIQHPPPTEIEVVNNDFLSSDENSSVNSVICDEINSLAKSLPTPKTARIRRSSQVRVSSTKDSQCDQNNSGSGILKESTANALCSPLEPNIIIVTGKATSTEKTASAQRLDGSYQSEDKIAKDWPSLETPTIIQHSPPADMENMAKPGETDGVKSKQRGVENVRPVAKRDYIQTKRQSSKRWRYAGTICLELLIFGLMAAILISVMHSGYNYILFVQYSLLELRIVYILGHSCNSKTDTEKKVKSGRVRSKVETIINTLLVAVLSGDLIMIQLSYYLVPLYSYAIVYSLLLIRQGRFTLDRIRNACTCHLSHTHRIAGLVISSLITIIYATSIITLFQLVCSGTILMTPTDFKMFLLFIFIALFPLYVHIRYATHRYSVHQSGRGTKSFGPTFFIVAVCVTYVGWRYLYMLFTWEICSSYHRGFNHGFQLGKSLDKTISNSSQVVTFYELDGLNNTYSTEYRCLLDLAEQSACPPYILRLFGSTFEDINSC